MTDKRAIMPGKRQKPRPNPGGKPGPDAKIPGPTPAFPLPHERDENAAEQEQDNPDPRIEQAHDDLKSGQRDTDQRGKAVDQFDRKFTRRERTR
jgi:hypothetical protein